MIAWLRLNKRWVLTTGGRVPVDAAPAGTSRAPTHGVMVSSSPPMREASKPAQLLNSPEP